MVGRQKIRRVLLVTSFALFPITLNYFSPYLIMESSAKGIVNGSFLVFASMFAGSLAFGRLWCGWACPAGGAQEMLAPANRRSPGRKADLVKWFIWVPWVALIAFAAVQGGGYTHVDPFYGTVGGISVAGDADRPVAIAYAVYLIVVGLFLVLAVTVGRRGACHTICWMAPFMILGRKLRNLSGWPSLQLASDSSACKKCGTCASECPMGLPVRRMVAEKTMENPECTLCGTCADSCPNGAIHYEFASPKHNE